MNEGTASATGGSGEGWFGQGGMWSFIPPPGPRRRVSDADLRVSDAERGAIGEALSRHFADGRLDQGELDERMGAAMSAKTRRDLAGLLADLPPLDGEPAGVSAAAVRGTPAGGLVPGSFGHGVVRAALLVLGTILALASLGSLILHPGAVVLPLFLVALVLLVARHRHYGCGRPAGRSGWYGRHGPFGW